MRYPDDAARSRSLADVAGGETVLVVEMIFDVVRQLCPSLDIHPGDVLDCEERTGRDIILRRGDGGRIAVDRFYASFVAIRPVEPGAWSHHDSNPMVS